MDQLVQVLFDYGISNLVGLSSVNKEFRQACWGREANYFLKRKLVVHFNGKKIVHVLISNRLRIGSPITTPWLVEIYENGKFSGTISYSRSQIKFDDLYELRGEMSWDEIVEWTRSRWPGLSKYVQTGLLRDHPALVYIRSSSSWRSRPIVLHHAMCDMGFAETWDDSKLLVSLRHQGTWFNWLLATYK